MDRKAKTPVKQSGIKKVRPITEYVRARISHYLASPRLFLEEFCYIKTSTTAGRSSSIIPFHLNNVQEKYYNLLVEKYFKPYGTRMRFQGIRETMMKSRQFGGSTLIQGIFFHDTITFDGTETYIYCQDKEFGSMMLNKPRMFHSRMPEEFKPQLGADNYGTLGFPNRDSWIKIGTPGVGETTARKQGRSLNMRNLHCSEVSDWANPQTTFQGLMEAVPADGNAFYEFSPRRMGDFSHVHYQNGLPKVLNRVWNSRFFPWFIFDNYQRPLTIERGKFKESLSEKERGLIVRYNLTFEQINWRRHKIAEKGFDEFVFLQEYPEDDVSCLRSHGQVIFPDEIRQKTTIEREAIPGHIHAIGADTSNGTEDGSESAIVVIDVNTMEQVWSWHGAIDPDALAYKIFEVWQAYPGIVGIEVNNMGIATVKTAFSIREWTDPFPGFLYSNNNMGGWQTNQKTKSMGIFLLKRALLSQTYNNNGLKIGSPDISEQLGWFQHLKNGKMGATGEVFNGKKLRDDLVMALMIAYGIIDAIPNVAVSFETKFGNMSSWDSTKQYKDAESKIIVPKVFFEER